MIKALNITNPKLMNSLAGRYDVSRIDPFAKLYCRATMYPINKITLNAMAYLIDIKMEALQKVITINNGCI